jgi:HEAT repeat protein
MTGVALGIIFLSAAPVRAQVAPPAETATVKAGKKEKGQKKGVAVVAAVKAAPKLTASELEKLSADLIDEDDQKVIGAATRLAEVGGDEALDRILEVLAIGTYPRVAPDLLNAVAEFKNPRSLHILAMYSGNLNFRVRMAAIKALAALPGPQSVDILIERLGDPHAEVRTIAAEALAERKEARSVPRLFALFKRNDAGAAGPLGRLADLDMTTKIAELRGTVADANLAVALGELLKRPGAPDRLRLDIVRTIGRIPGADATTALVEFVGSLDPKDASPARDEAQTLIDQRGDL